MFNIFKKNKHVLKSDIILDINYNKRFEIYEGKAFIEVFNQYFDVEFSTSLDYAEKCVIALNNKKLYDNIRSSLVKHCNESVEDYLEFEEYRVLYKLPEDKILSHVGGLSIYIDESRDDSIGYSINGSCDWNEEHGFIIVIRDNKIVHIGEHDNLYSPWDNY